MPYHPGLNGLCMRGLHREKRFLTDFEKGIRQTTGENGEESKEHVIFGGAISDQLIILR
jgi:hypothetical protein